MLSLHTVRTSSFRENCYILANKETKQAVIIDPGYEADKIAQPIQENAYTIKGYLITHAHCDHLSALEALQASFPAPVYLNPSDAPFLVILQGEQQKYGLTPSNPPSSYEEIQDKKIIQCGDLRFLPITTPGHSPGGTCFLIEDKLFTGDTLFARNIGRSDFILGNHDELIRSIKEKLYTLDDNITIYPGHGTTSTIGYEKNNNPFCSFKS